MKHVWRLLAGHLVALLVAGAPLNAYASANKEQLPVVEGDDYGILAMSFGEAFGIVYFTLPFSMDNDSGQYFFSAIPGKVFKNDYKGKIVAPYTMGDLPAGKSIDFWEHCGFGIFRPEITL